MGIKGDPLRAQIHFAPLMYAKHAWLDEVHSDGVKFGNTVFTFGPFVPFVDLPGLVNRANWCNEFKDNVTQVQKDDLDKLLAFESDIQGDGNVVACDKHALSHDNDSTLSSTLEGRTRHDTRQTHILNAYYSKDPKPMVLQREKLAEGTGMTCAQVTTWFNNHRKREIVFLRHSASRQARAGRSNRSKGS